MARPSRKATAAEIVDSPWRVIVLPVADTGEFALRFREEADALDEIDKIFKQGFVAEFGESNDGSNWTWYHPISQIKRLEVQKVTS